MDISKSVSIIIPTLNHSDYVRNCVSALNKFLDRDNVEILVVDDGSTEEEHTKLVDLANKLDFILLTNSINSGFSKAVNLGLVSARNTLYKLVLNNDVIAEDDFLTPMLDRINKTRGCGVVGAKLIYPDRRIQFAGHIRNPFSPKWFDHLYRGQDENFIPANKSYEVIGITGACFLTTEAILKEVEENYGHYGFDTNYPMAFEDVDFCFKIRKLGYTCWYEPKATLVHIEGATRGVGQQSISDLKQQESIRYFWKTWSEDEVDELSKMAF